MFTLYSRMTPLCVRLGGGSHETLTLELLFCFSRDTWTALGGALGTERGQREFKPQHRQERFEAMKAETCKKQRPGNMKASSGREGNEALISKCVEFFVCFALQPVDSNSSHDDDKKEISEESVIF